MAKKNSGGSCGPHLTAEDEKRQEEWALEDDARTLQRAAEIRADKKRLARVKQWAADKAAALRTIK